LPRSKADSCATERGRIVVSFHVPGIEED